MLCAAYCDKEATLDFLAMEDKPSGRYTSDLFSTRTAHIKISNQFPDSGRGVIQRRCQWRCHLPPAPPSPLPPPLPSTLLSMVLVGCAETLDALQNFHADFAIQNLRK